MRFCFFLAFATLGPLALAEEPAFINNAAHASGELGMYPHAIFVTTDLVSPRLNNLVTSPKCIQGLHTFITPRGDDVKTPGPMILDEDGSLVWMKKMEERGTYGLTVQTYKGQDFLTFWAGDDSGGGHGFGTYYMLDSTYEEVYRIEGARGFHADLHDMIITPEGTALYTVYDMHMVAISVFGKGKSKHEWIWDGLIQEIDIETGKLLFEWRASDHFNITDSFLEFDGVRSIATRSLDFIHINSIDKDPHGNYLVSARYFSTVFYIDGKTGNVLWELGGRRNDFVDLSGGKATNFSYQHHARWHDNYTTITLLDNGACPGDRRSPYSKGLYIKLDLEANPKTAELVQDFVDKINTSSDSQGSVQILENGNFLLGYGQNGWWAEFASDGTLLCETFFESENGLKSGLAQSFRVMKHKWVGRPMTNPAVKVMNESTGGGLVVSWMGATEVRFWAVEIAGSAEEAEAEQYTEVSRTRKTGFETKLELARLVGYLRVVAHGADGDVLGRSDMINLDDGESFATNRVEVASDISVPIVLIIGVIGFMSGVMMTWSFIRWRLRVKNQKEEDGDDGDDEDDEESEGFLSHELRQTSGSGTPGQTIPNISVDRNCTDFNHATHLP